VGGAVAVARGQFTAADAWFIVLVLGDRTQWWYCR
jgi:hypothetical protein